ncbi:unnamed protein product, partial [Closterium sp. NIES-54]
RDPGDGGTSAGGAGARGTGVGDPGSGGAGAGGAGASGPGAEALCSGTLFSFRRRRRLCCRLTRSIA